MLHTKRPIVYLLIGAYLAVLLANSICNIPTTDSLYYWSWGKHLGLSYYDGPPLVGYLTWLARHLLGQSLFSMNIIGLIAFVIEGTYVYRLTLLASNNRHTARLATLLFLFSPQLFFRVMFSSLSEQPFLALYSASLFYFARYLQREHTRDIYQLALCLSLLLLSRYNGILLFGSLLTVLVLNVDIGIRTFKNKHTYLALGCIAVCFSPVIIWNAQHGWISWRYQTSFHLVTHHNPWQAMLRYTWDYFTSIGWMLLLCRFAVIRKKTHQLLLADIVCTFIFWLLYARTHHVHNYYLYSSIIALSILLAESLQLAKLKKTAVVIVLGLFIYNMQFALLNLYEIHRHQYSMMTDNTFQNRSTVKKILAQLPSDAIILTNNWVTATWLDYWKAHTMTLAPLPNCGRSNQYGLWSPPLAELISSNRPLYFVTDTNATDCLQHYDLTCTFELHANSTIPSVQPTVYTRAGTAFDLYRCQR